MRKGGDDVQQLCDAGEEEFLEIMALVGMASKPLHVRRLQKSLHEWAMNPAIFQTPLSHLGKIKARLIFIYQENALTQKRIPRSRFATIQQQHL